MRAPVELCTAPALREMRKSSEKLGQWGGQDSNLRSTDYESRWNGSSKPHLA